MTFSQGVNRLRTDEEVRKVYQNESYKSLSRAVDDSIEEVGTVETLETLLCLADNLTTDISEHLEAKDDQGDN